MAEPLLSLKKVKWDREPKTHIPGTPSLLSPGPLICLWQAAPRTPLTQS